MVGRQRGKLEMRRVFLSSFGVIVVLFGGSVLAGTWRSNRSHVEVLHTWQNAFSSVELVSRIGRDFERERRLIDLHIFEQDVRKMQSIEQRFDVVQYDLDRSVRTYRSLAMPPDEQAVWRDLESDHGVVGVAVAAAFDLSRVNRDAEARQRLQLVEDRFTRIDGDVERLVDLNRATAAAVLAKSNRSLRSSTVLSATLALTGILVTLVIVIVASRLVHRREDVMVNETLQLEAQNRELDAFAARVAHDLRGPLTTLNMAGARLADPNVDVVSTGAFIRRASARMEALIRDLLALSQVEKLSRDATCDPAASVATVREEVAARVEAAGGALHTDVEPARVSCNEGLLLQVLSNLSDNALKYARPEVKPALDIRGRRSHGIYELRIADNGMGMSPDEARQAFTPFYRAMRSPTAPGTGLGLSIVKRVAEASGGTVDVESTLGLGTTFVVRLRLVDGELQTRSASKS